MQHERTALLDRLPGWLLDGVDGLIDCLID